MGHIFISYHRESAENAGALAEDIRSHGHQVWFDQELTGGQTWWDKILEKIRECDAFVFVLDPKALDSTPCICELEYASALNKPILPVQVSQEVSIETLHPSLAKIQYVDYCADGREGYRQLSKALSDLPPPGAVPDPLPKPPELPVSGLGKIASLIRDPSDLSAEDQSWLVHQLKRDLETDSHIVLPLLRKLKKRPEIIATIDKEIDKLLNKYKHDTGPEEPPLKPPGTLARIGSVIKKVIAVAFAVGIALVIGQSVYQDSRPIAEKIKKQTADVRATMNQIRDPKYPMSELLAAHKHLAVALERTLKLNLNEFEERSVKEDFAAWHVSVAEVARERNVQAAFDENIRMAKSLDPDNARLRELLNQK